MAQRKYRMQQRAAAVDETKRRILEATSACHRERGMTATGMDDVAARAGVAVGTVYRHFPSLDHLVGACGAVFMSRFELPEPTQAADLFRGLRGGAKRLARLIDEIAGRYRGGAIGFVRIREARDDFEAATEAHAKIERSLDALVAEATRPLRYSAERRQALRALVDARVWQALVDHGLDTDTVERTLHRLAAAI